MKKRILSLVLCAAMLLSMVVLMGAGTAGDPAVDTTESVSAPQTVVYTAAGPFLPVVSVQPQVLRAARVAAAKGSADGGSLALNKQVTANADGAYTITMEAYTTGTVTTSTTTTPCDIVLVLDQSGSMAYDFNGEKANKDADRRQYAMKQAVNNFIGAVADKYDADTSDHRISIVTFGSNASTLQGWTTVDKAGMATLKGKINGLPVTPYGATNVAAGMQQAETLMGSGYNYTGANTNRQKVVIVFTDGVPTERSDFSTSVANTAIQSAKAMKDSGVTVYSVGIFTGANPEQTYGDKGFKENSSGQVKTHWANRNGLITGGDLDACDVPAGNRFLNYISSNYKEADEIGLKEYYEGHLVYSNEGWEITKNFDRTSTSYYLTANNSDSLNTIFTSISQNVGSTSVDLGSKTAIKDVVTPYFTLPKNSSDIHVYTADCTGAGPAFADRVAASDVTASIDSASRTVSVTGFNFNENYVTEQPRDPGNTYGKKLIIEFTVKRSDGFVGGNNVPTNGDTSGVYTDKGVCVDLFDVPKANVPIKAPTLTGADCNVYYLGTQLTPDQLCNPYDTSGNDFSFVDVTYTANCAVDMTRDGVYTATATIKPKEVAENGSVGTPAAAETATATANVNVYKPVVTVRDSSINLGDTADYSQNLDATKVVWKHDTTEAVPVNMIGEAPELIYEYSPEASAFTQDTYVNVTVKIGEQDITEDAVTFHRDACTFPGCNFDSSQGEFIVHINTFDLTITKSGNNIDPNQTFVFNVKNNDTGKTMEVVITGTGSKKITGLPVGSYTVTEDTNWSWQYKPENSEGSKTVASSDIVSGEASVTFVNVKQPNHWLTSFAEVINKWITENDGKVEITPDVIWPKN